MNNKIIIIIIVLAVVVSGGYFLLTSFQSPTQEPSPTSVSTSPVPTVQTADTVLYADSGYSPSTLRVKVGTAVSFKNNSSQAMWTASADHPTHRLYPVTGGCIGSLFDACAGIKPGDSWVFKFDIAGTWKYHNHLSPSNTGTIVVE